MKMPIEINYGGEEIFLHEPGCECGYDHDGRFGENPDARIAILTSLDQKSGMRYFQIWYRTGAWGLHQAIEQLLDRKRNRSGGRAA